MKLSSPNPQHHFGISRLLRLAFNFRRRCCFQRDLRRRKFFCGGFTFVQHHTWLRLFYGHFRLFRAPLAKRKLVPIVALKPIPDIDLRLA